MFRYSYHWLNQWGPISCLRIVEHEHICMKQNSLQVESYSMVQLWIASDIEYHKQCNDQRPRPLQFALPHWQNVTSIIVHTRLPKLIFSWSKNGCKSDMEFYMFLKWTIFNSCLDFAPRPPELVVKTKNKKSKKWGWLSTLHYVPWTRLLESDVEFSLSWLSTWPW